LLLLSLGLVLVAPRPASAAQGEVAAAWKRHEIEFTYMGFTTQYSCEGLRDKMRLLLAASGTRADYKVTTRACIAEPGRVERFPRVRMVFFAPEIPAPGSRDAGEPTVARWKSVSIARRQPRDLEQGDCELVEQFRDRVLPALATRKLDSDINCIPHQLSGSSFRLRYEVLEGLPSPDTVKPPR
jgi:hypothetical protein